MLPADAAGCAAAEDELDWYLFGWLVPSAWAGGYRADGEQMVP
jgi:hypothetical protein